MGIGAIAQSGMNAATFRVANAAGNVANQQTPDYEARRVDLVERREGGVQVSQVRREEGLKVPGQSNVDLATELTGMVASAGQLKANAQVLKTEDEMLGGIFEAWG